MSTRTVISARFLVVVGALLAPGCYGGIGSMTGDDEAQAEGDGGGDEGDGGDEGGDAPPELPPMDNSCSVQPNLMGRLTRAEYNNTVRDLLHVDSRPADQFVADGTIGRSYYSNTATTVDLLQVEHYQGAAESLSAEVDLALVTPCDPAASGEAECAAEFITEFGRRAFRRPVTDEEHKALLDIWASQNGFEAGVRLVIETILQAPSFLYHVQLPPEGAVGEVYALSQYEVASRLSYLIWNTMPDDELLDAAEAGQLETPEQVEAQAARMMEDERFSDALRDFSLQWLGLNRIDSVFKDPDLFPEWTPELHEALIQEPTTFFEQVVRFGDAKFDTLLLADFTWGPEEVAELYGVEMGDPTLDGGRLPNGFAELVLDPNERSGILTLASVMATFAFPRGGTDIVHRGQFVREHLLCQKIGAPPPNVDDTIPEEPSPNETRREQYERHRTDPACNGCHVLIDPLGFGFEHYDALGRFRSEENGASVDARGEVVAAQDPVLDNVEFEGAIELSQLLAQSEVASRCMTQQWLKYTLQRNVEKNAEACTLDGIYEPFAASDEDLRELIIATVRSNEFRLRSASAPDAGGDE